MAQMITINGQEFELSPKKPDVKTMRVGDRVKLLIKGYNEWKTYPGIIMSVDDFKTHPTINIVYLNMDYRSSEIKTVAFNDDTKDVEVVFLQEDDRTLDIDQGAIMDNFNRLIEAKKAELADLFYKQEYFRKNFGKFFGGI